MDIGGIIAGALGGGAKATGELADNAIQMQNKSDYAKQQNDLEIAKARAAEDYKVQLGNTQRTDRAARINTAQGGIIDGLMAGKYAGTDAAIDAAHNGQTDAPLTADQQSVIDQALPANKAADRARLQANPDLRIQAMGQTGDLAPEQEALINGRQAALEASNQRLRDGLDSKEAIANDRLASSERNTDVRVQAALDKALAKSSPDQKHDRLTTIVNSANATIKNLADGDRGRTPEAKAAWQRQMDDATALRDTAMTQLKSTMLGDQPTSTVKPAAAPGAARKDVADAASAWLNQK